ncbi:hypothetical protein CHH28_17190 [Bacterioplanes sanyensis]|uniref:DNA alkylation repair protein n=1 Tax=Bacterioplanes sanyensis TaxID=1249553 RepID=A0A222FMP8_9GAMM|nr:DNA alkylation repair protein [Bacterioplanes sanyensis]ASP40305.1 hypothetical protein CHH28_17190 [Bacterioplanes sanyensis]
MPEAFKEHFNADAVLQLAEQLQQVWHDFDQQGFIARVAPNLAPLELKQRSDLIRQSLHEFLPADFEQAVAILCSALAPKSPQGWQGSDAPGISGWMIMPVADYVAEHGQQQVELSLSALKQMTSRFSSEFAIRPFLQQHPQQTLSTLQQWLHDDDEHVRRLISEGTRPRLPWGVRLTQFIDEPSTMIPLLEALRDDPSDYVRRSVANHLNDIAKDHPELVAELSRCWSQGANEQRMRLLRHACRTLIKQGHQATLAVFGYGEPQLEGLAFTVTPARIRLGDSICLELTVSAAVEQSLVIDYAIHHQRANGTTRAKVFKWRQAQLSGGEEASWQKQHAIKPITTRNYYPGRHQVDVLINGQVMASAQFELQQ